MQAKKLSIGPAKGKLGVVIPGMGAITTTFIAGLESILRGYVAPIGSITQMGHIRLGRRDTGTNPLIKDFLPLANIKDLVIGGWDIFPENMYDAAMNAKVLRKDQLDPVRDKLESIKPMKAVFDNRFVKNISGPNLKTEKTLWDKAQALKDDILRFKQDNDCDRIVMIWIASTEAWHEASEVHQSLEAFEEGLRTNNPSIAPSQIYAYAALSLGIPYINGAPHMSTDCPALMELAERNCVAVAGKDFKTGQTLMKTIIAPGLKARMLGVAGWFSTNILGNRDGEVLDDPESFKSKEVSKLSVLDTIFQADLYPELYKNMFHKVRINYYPPRGDDKEGWDNIDIFGWMNMPMQIKIDFLCRDSILAAPLVLDLILLMDLGQRAGMKGIQEWLSFFFKSPLHAPGLYPEHDLFIQLTKLKNTMRFLMGEELITHLGMDYYNYFD
jgi:myo-inositol-1-phosphate synthase